MPCKPPVESSPRMQEALPSAENHSKHYTGSSPRMRGAPRLPEVGLPLLGIIPADAGSTEWIVKVRYPGPDHPRGCGGAPVRGAGHGLLLGIIPADAGSTTCHGDRRGSSQDHPRGCGEHPARSSHPMVTVGSSPRMRGAQQGPGPTRQRCGIIPADAGSTG